MTPSTKITAAMLYDLVQCPHRPAMDLFGDPARRDEISPFIQLLWEKGTAYENEVIDGLDVPFLDLSRYAGDEKEQRTLDAMERGEPLIYSARITADDLLGDPDLLRRAGNGYVAGDIKSGSGEYGDGDDAKLKKHYGVQLALYTDILERRGRASSKRPFVWDVHGEEVTYDLEEPQGERNPWTMWEIYQDALARSQRIVAQTEKATILSLGEGEINELHVGLKGTMNALFLKDLAQKTRRGQRGRVEAGKIPGGNSYGYKIVRRLLADGRAATGEREVDPDQAAIVQRIFEEYAAGMAPRTIAQRLNREGIPGPRGGYWNASTINGNRKRRNGILNNELYVGRITYNRQRFVKDPETGKRLARLNPRHEWICQDVPELRIIDEDLWDRVQARKARYSSQTGNKRQSKKRLLSGLIKCGRCGGGMTIARCDRYYCSARREKGICDADRGIGVVELEDRVLSGLRDILLGNEELIVTFVSEFKKELERLRKERRSRDHRLSKEIGDVNRGIERCLAFITGGDGDPGIVRDELARLQQRKSEIEASLRHDLNKNVVIPHPNLVQIYAKKVENLREVLNDETARPEAMEIIRSLIDRIEVYPGQRRGQCDVALVGALAGILALAQKETTAASGKDDGTFLMVAGARSHLYRTHTLWRGRGHANLP